MVKKQIVLDIFFFQKIIQFDSILLGALQNLLLKNLFFFKYVLPLNIIYKTKYIKTITIWSSKKYTELKKHIYVQYYEVNIKCNISCHKFCCSEKKCQLEVDVTL